nr:ribonuclease H-like domain-containing protein [Tanacetum cinerariifolium]
LANYQEFKGGSVAFGGSYGRITDKEKIKAGRLDFKDVYYLEELRHYNQFSLSQMCNKKNKVLFTDIDCLVLSPDFKLPDENQVLLKMPRQHNMYSFNLKNIDPSRDLSCLFTKAIIDESNKWHKRPGHVNFKNINKLMKGNLVRGLPSKIFENDHTCVACQKGKQHKASCKAKTDETTPILKDFIRQAENQFNHKVKTIRSDNGTEFKNNDLIEICGLKENQANKSAGPKEANNNARTQANDDQGANSKEIDLHDENFVLPIWYAYSTTVKISRDKIQKTTDCKTCEKLVSQVDQIFQEELEKLKRQEKEANAADRKEANHAN